jgi:hypothetical protein
MVKTVFFMYFSKFAHSMCKDNTELTHMLTWLMISGFDSYPSNKDFVNQFI